MEFPFSNLFVALGFPYRFDKRERNQESAAASRLFLGLSPVHHQRRMMVVKLAKKTEFLV